MEPFIAAIKAAEKLTDALAAMTEHRDSLSHRLSAANGANKELQEQVERLQAALGVAADAASTRKAMVYELTAQISMLGKLFMHCGDEVIKIVNSLDKQGLTKKEPAPETKITGTENLEVEMIGPLVGVANEDEALKALIATAETQEADRSTIPFAKPLEGKRTHLLSGSVIPTPAFLNNNGLTRELTVEEHQSMTFRERKEYVRNGTIPHHLRRFSSG